MYEAKGTVDRVFPPESPPNSDKIYRTFWLMTAEDEPQFIRLQLRGLLCAILDEYEVGTHVRIFFSISGRPSGDTLYNNHNVNTIEKITIFELN